jgi:hypothetical protein
VVAALRQAVDKKTTGPKGTADDTTLSIEVVANEECVDMDG